MLHGAVVCTPSGICDPGDSTTCGNTPPPNVSPGGEISTTFIKRLAERNPLLAGAVWGAITEQDSAAKEILHSYLMAGEYSGTMGKDGKSYTFRTRVQPLAGGVFSLAVHVEEDGTGRAEEFEGTVLERGWSGSVARVGREGRVSVFSWNAREPEKK